MRLLLDVRVPDFHASPRALARAAARMGRELGLGEAVTVSLVLCSARVLARLSGVHFGLSRTTDVIAFPTGFEEFEGMLGEVWIAPETVGRNGIRFGKGLNGEFLFVLAHGFLHLLGWDDATPARRKRMFGRQEELMEACRAVGGELPVALRRLGTRGGVPLRARRTASSINSKGDSD